MNADGQDNKDLNLEAQRQGQKFGQKNFYFEFALYDLHFPRKFVSHLD